MRYIFLYHFNTFFTWTIKCWEYDIGLFNEMFFQLEIIVLRFCVFYHKYLVLQYFYLFFHVQFFLSVHFKFFEMVHLFILFFYDLLLVSTSLLHFYDIINIKSQHFVIWIIRTFSDPQNSNRLFVIFRSFNIIIKFHFRLY